MIHISNLSKRYNSTLALDRLSLEVPDGAVFGLLGPNGAGKTTLLRLVMGFVFADSGEVDRGTLAPAQIGYLPERAFYPPRFAIRDYLGVLGRLTSLPHDQVRRKIAHLLAQLDLEEAASRKLGACSRGMLQRVGLAQALLGNPPLLLLDEPALGLDPAGQKFMREQVVLLHNAGKTILLASHRLDEVTRICSHVGILNRGRLARSGPLESILTPRSLVTITTSPLPDGLPSRLAALAPEIAVTDKQITLTGEATAHKAEVLRLLLDAGVDIRQLAEQHATLEEIYLEATAK
jgi:ABC-2 type transport system ATP-binding protein